MEREAAGRPVTVGLIGAGKFGTMFMAQARLTRGMHLVGIADLEIVRARSQLRNAGWPDQAFSAGSLADAHNKRATFVTDDAGALIADPRIEVIVEATGVPGAGIEHVTRLAQGVSEPGRVGEELRSGDRPAAAGGEDRIRAGMPD